MFRLKHFETDEASTIIWLRLFEWIFADYQVRLYPSCELQTIESWIWRITHRFRHGGVSCLFAFSKKAASHACTRKKYLSLHEKTRKNRHMEIKMTFNTLHKHTTTQVKVEKVTQRPFPSILEYHSSWNLLEPKAHNFIMIILSRLWDIQGHLKFSDTFTVRTRI